MRPRSPKQANEVVFDWMQPKLAVAAFYDIQAMYIVAPTNSRSTALSYSVSHVNLTSDQLVERFQQQGMDENYAHIMASMDTAIAGGSEDRMTNNVEILTGRKPTCFADFVAREISAW